MKDRNENRPEYKKTKAGWIPEEWKCCFLRDLCIGPGQYGACTPAIPYSQNFPRYIRITDITDDGDLLETNRASIEPEFSEKYLLDFGHFLFARTGGTVGKTYLHEKKLGQYAFAGYLIRFIPNENVLIGGFLKNYTKTDRYRYWVKTIVHTGAQPNINADEYGAFLIPLPPLQEQKKISDILSTWDEAIEQTRKLIDSKRLRKKSLTQQLLTGKRRLRPYEKPNGRKSYRFFDLPEDWTCPQIKEIAQECSERNTGRNDLPVLACSKHVGFVKSSDYFGKRVFSEDTSNYRIIKRGQFGFPSNHIEEGSIGLLQKQDIGLVSPIYTVFRCNENIIPEYLYAVFKTDTFRHIFKVSTNASVDRRGSLRWKEFSLIHIPMPTREEQKAIAKVLKTSDDEIFQIEAKLKAVEKQKRGLMQKLLTGEVRVKL